MKVLITGANGLVGRHIVTMLQARGDDVRALVLPGEDSTWLEERGAAVFRGDVRQPQALVEPMRGVEGVLNLAGLMGVWKPMHEYHAVNVAGAENVCRAALAAGVRRVVHVSSWRVYGNGVGVPCREDFPLRASSDPYSRTKLQGEGVVRRLSVEAGLRAVIIRPGTIIGPEDRLHFGRLAERLRSGVSLVVGSGRNALPLVYVTDVAHGMVLALVRDAAVGQAYNIGSDEVMTQEELLRGAASELGVKPPSLHVPYPLLYAAAFSAEQVAMLPGYGRNPVLTREGVTLFGTDNRLSIEKARSELGYVPQVGLREGVRLAGAWYRSESGMPAAAIAVPQSGGVRS
jgi:nucleoside-diphosphate-sugar epimerase